MLRDAPAAGPVVRSEELEALPPPVQRWLRRAGVVGRPRAETVHLRQTGEMHTAPDGAWFPVEAEQWFRADSPAFVWWMEGRMASVIPLAGRDLIGQGHGEMHVTAGGLFDVAYAEGPKIDQAALLRWLAETMWFPSATLRPFVTWSPVDHAHAKATVAANGLTVSATFAFDDEGRVLGLEAQRYYGADGNLERWGGRNTEWDRVNGVEIPTRGEVIWYLAGGDFSFFRWHVFDVETNTAGGVS